MSVADLLDEKDSVPADWRDGAGADITITIAASGNQFQLHRRALVNGPRASLWLRAELEGDPPGGGGKSSEGTEVVLGDDVVPEMCTECVPNLLDYVYEGSLDGVPMHRLVPVLKLGFTLDIKELRQRAYSSMRTMLAAESPSPVLTAVTFLKQALLLSPGLDNVIKAAVLAIAGRLGELSPSELATLPPRAMTDLMTSERLTASESTKSSAVAAYLRAHEATPTRGTAAGRSGSSGSGDSSGAHGADMAGAGDDERPGSSAGAGKGPGQRTPIPGGGGASSGDSADADAFTYGMSPGDGVDRDMFLGMTHSVVQVNPEDALFLLSKALDYDAPQTIINRCIAAAAKGFEVCELSDLLTLPIGVVRTLLSRDDLYVVSETSVFRAVTAYLTRLGATRGESMASDDTLWAVVRFPFLPLPTLLHATAVDTIPTRMVMEGITAAMMVEKGEAGEAQLARYVADGSHPAPGGVSRLSPRPSYRKVSLRHGSRVFGAAEGKRDEETLKTVKATEDVLCEWVAQAAGDGPSRTRRFVLVYRASTHGWGAGAFHAACDGVGPTLVLVSTEGGHVFGGYAAAPWSSSGGFIQGHGSFMFTLRCAAGLKPTLMRLRRGEAANALYCDPTCGPTFGEGYDLHVASDAPTGEGKSYCHVGSTYEAPPELPAGYSKHTFLTGAPQFWPSEVEVFRVADE